MIFLLFITSAKNIVFFTVINIWVAFAYSIVETSYLFLSLDHSTTSSSTATGFAPTSPVSHQFINAKKFPKAPVQ